MTERTWTDRAYQRIDTLRREAVAQYRTERDANKALLAENNRLLSILAEHNIAAHEPEPVHLDDGSLWLPGTGRIAPTAPRTTPHIWDQPEPTPPSPDAIDLVAKTQRTARKLTRTEEATTS